MRKRKQNQHNLESWQQVYLNFDGSPRPEPETIGEILADAWLARLLELDARKPPFLDKSKCRTGWELFRDHGQDTCITWAKDRPGCRPFPFWRWGANFPREKALTACKWPPEQQRQYLEQHGFLLEGEK